MNNKQCTKTTFEDQMNLLLFACHASAPFTVKDVQEAVMEFHRNTVYSLLQKFVEWNYLERISTNHYCATQYAKDIMNVNGEVVE